MVIYLLCIFFYLNILQIFIFIHRFAHLWTFLGQERMETGCEEMDLSIYVSYL
jgi:hypothetical protein